MKTITDVLKEINQDLVMLQTTSATVATSDVATGFESAVVAYLQSILENQKVLATHLANHQLLLRRAGYINNEPTRTNVIAGEGGSRGLRKA